MMKHDEKWVAPPRERLRERFTCEGTETTGEYAILDRGEPVFRFKRPFPGGRVPFEPFRQLRDSVWRNYALISPLYTSFAVVDLQTFDVIERSPSPADIAKFDELVAKDSSILKNRPTVEEFLRVVGFCPFEFKVVDNWDLWADGPDDNEWGGWDDADLDMMEPQERVTGEGGFVSGCIWGDDWSFKVQFIDLSRISEGYVTSDDRFGYVPIPRHLALDDTVRVNEYDTNEIDFCLPVRYSMVTGTARDYSVDFPWAKENR